MNKWIYTVGILWFTLNISLYFLCKPFFFIIFGMWFFFTAFCFIAAIIEELERDNIMYEWGRLNPLFIIFNELKKLIIWTRTKLKK